jgi:hypothetical protein
MADINRGVPGLSKHFASNIDLVHAFTIHDDKFLLKERASYLKLRISYIALVDICTIANQSIDLKSNFPYISLIFISHLFS